MAKRDAATAAAPAASPQPKRQYRGRQPAEFGELAEGDDAADAESDALGKIYSAFNDAGAGEVFVASVYQVIPVPGKAPREVWWFDCEIDELRGLRQRVSQEIGGGKFRCRIKKDDRPFRQYDFEIAVQPGRKIGGTAAPVPSSEIPPAIAAILDQQNRILAALAERAAPPAQSQQSSMKDTLELIKAMRDAMPAPPPNNGLEFFQKGMELALKFNEGGGNSGGGGKGLIDLFSEVLNSPVIGNALANLGKVQQRQAPPPNQGTPPALPMRRPIAAEPPQPAGASATAGAALGPAPGLQDVINFLISEAQQGKQPQLVADWVLDNIPGEALAYIESQADPVAYVVSLFPAVAQYRGWFESLFNAIYVPAEDDAGAVNDGLQHMPDGPAPDDRNTGRGGGNARSAQAHEGRGPQGQA